MNITRGMIVTNTSEGDKKYVCTRRWGLYFVLDTDCDDIQIKTIASDNIGALSNGSTWWVKGKWFEEITPEKWFSEYPDAVLANDFNDYFINMPTATEGDLKMVKNPYTIPTEQLDYYKKEIMEFLPRYRFNKIKPELHYTPTEKGVNALLEEYAKNKGWLYPYFMSHPNYIGNGKIAFSSDYHRKVNGDGVRRFMSWIECRVVEWLKERPVTINGMTYSEAKQAKNRIETIYNYMSTIERTCLGQGYPSVRVNEMTSTEIANEYYRIRDIVNKIYDMGYTCDIDSNFYTSLETKKKYNNYMAFLGYIKENPHMFTTEEDVTPLNKYTADLDLRIVKGQKFSKIVNKFCTKLGFNKHPEYNAKFPIFSDDINELDIKRHTIISINPIDYLSMSFGNSWKSCHTIDKFNDRNIGGEGWGGCYSGGTVSYMLDESSIVYYTVDKRYDGTDFEFEPKVNRCMFHLGEDKLVQGRVYPQTNDGDQTIYTEIRTIMQKVTAEMFGVDNYWIIARGTSACASVIYTKGVHYPDYLNFSNCNVSYLKPTKNTKKIIVGHDPICPKCGKVHTYRNCILCEDCEQDKKFCPHCGSEINDCNRTIEINGEVYCEDCAHFCDFHQEYEIDTEMIDVYVNYHLNHSGRRYKTYGVVGDVVQICRTALEENPQRYRKCSETYRIFDTERHTQGCIVRYTSYDGSAKEAYYCFKELAKRSGYKETHTGIWYLENEVHYNRRTNAYYHDSEWNVEYNCPECIVDEVREEQEMLARRAERRAEREARRSNGTAA